MKSKSIFLFPRTSTVVSTKHFNKHASSSCARDLERNALTVLMLNKYTKSFIKYKVLQIIS